LPYFFNSFCVCLYIYIYRAYRPTHTRYVHSRVCTHSACILSFINTEFSESHMSCISITMPKQTVKTQLPLCPTLKVQCIWNQFSCKLTLTRGAVRETTPSVHISATRKEQCARAHFLLLESKRFVHVYHLLLLCRTVLCNGIYFLMHASNDSLQVCLLLLVSNVSAQP